MTPQEPRGPFCQSCGMPLNGPVDFGTDAGGCRVNDYCQFCFRDGEFTEPDISMPQMIDRCVMFMSTHGVMTQSKARALLTEEIPRMRRWRAPAAPRNAPAPEQSDRRLLAAEEIC
jgi:hypothetical protein